jgi:hypothetical protein
VERAKKKRETTAARIAAAKEDAARARRRNAKKAPSAPKTRAVFDAIRGGERSRSEEGNEETSNGAGGKRLGGLRGVVRHLRDIAAPPEVKPPTVRDVGRTLGAAQIAAVKLRGEVEEGKIRARIEYEEMEEAERLEAEAAFQASERGASYTLVPIRPRSRCARRSLRTFPGASLRPGGSLGFNPRPRRLSTPTDAFELHPDVRLYGTPLTETWDARFRVRSATIDALKEIARERGLRGYSKLRRAELLKLVEEELWGDEPAGSGSGSVGGVARYVDEPEPEPEPEREREREREGKNPFKFW